MVIYTFKTEEEFIRDYGEDWRKDVINWTICKSLNKNESMDYLFGREITEQQYINGSFQLDRWSIHANMLTWEEILDDKELLSTIPAKRVKKIVEFLKNLDI